MNKMGNSKTVYRTILRPLLIVVLVEIVKAVQRALGKDKNAI